VKRTIAVLFALVAVGCSSSTKTSSIPTPAGCPKDFRTGQTHDAAPACFPSMLDAAMRAQNVSYDHVAGEKQAVSICRRFDTDGDPRLTETAVVADWANGAVTPPTPTKSGQLTYLAAAVSVYCQAHFADLR
jgi:hypothetical protein